MRKQMIFNYNIKITMRKKITYPFLFILIISGLYAPVYYSQIPTYTCTLLNDVQTAPNVYKFDVYILRTGTDVFELSGFQIGLTYNVSAINGGTLTVAWDTTSMATDTTIFISKGTRPKTTAPYSPGIIKAASFLSPGAGSGVIIPNSAPGARYGRLVLTNSVPFASQPLSVNWAFSIYSTKISAYISGTNTDITNQTEFINNLGNGILPIELNSFISKASERKVYLSWETKIEVNSSKFEIYHALVNAKDAGGTWVLAGSVPASGSSSSPKKYSFTEKDLQAGKYQYRLKMVDKNGAYKFSSIVETVIALPKDYEVSQNYPNPFNPSTRINYSLPFDSKVKIEVFNIAGERVGQIVNEEQSAGYYTVNFNSSALYSTIASGVYIYRVIAVDNSKGNVFTSIKKMMLLK